MSTDSSNASVREARQLLEEAHRHVDRNNLHQACGKGWQAAARMARATAAAQGWRCHPISNGSFHEVMDQARALTGDDRFRTLSGRARELEGAYFQVRENLDKSVVRADLQDVAQLVELLEPLARQQHGETGTKPQQPA